MKQILLPPRTFMRGPSNAVACCPTALWCPLSSAVAAVLACSSPAPVWISTAFSMAKD